jgi:hypothetical protein
MVDRRVEFLQCCVVVGQPVERVARMGVDLADDKEMPMGLIELVE